MKKITREELNKRVKETKNSMEDNIMVTLPKGTKERLYSYADNLSKYCRELILKDLDKKEKAERKKLQNEKSNQKD